jgi:hypothetical protein
MVHLEHGALELGGIGLWFCGGLSMLWKVK